MVQLKSSKTGSLELTDRGTTVSLDTAKVTLGDQLFDTPGEYEASGVEVVYGQGACLIVWERLQLVYVFAGNAPTAFEREQFASSDVLIFAQDLEEINKTTLNVWLDAYDPKIVIFSRETPIETQLKASLKLRETSPLKLTDQTLPAEDRDFYVVA